MKHVPDCGGEEIVEVQSDVCTHDPFPDPMCCGWRGGVWVSWGHQPHWEKVPGERVCSYGFPLPFHSLGEVPLALSSPSLLLAGLPSAWEVQAARGKQGTQRAYPQSGAELHPDPAGGGGSGRRDPKPQLPAAGGRLGKLSWAAGWGCGCSSARGSAERHLWRAVGHTHTRILAATRAGDPRGHGREHGGARTGSVYVRAQVRAVRSVCRPAVAAWEKSRHPICALLVRLSSALSFGRVRPPRPPPEISLGILYLCLFFFFCSLLPLPSPSCWGYVSVAKFVVTPLRFSRSSLFFGSIAAPVYAQTYWGFLVWLLFFSFFSKKIGILWEANGYWGGRS